MFRITVIFACLVTAGFTACPDAILLGPCKCTEGDILDRRYTVICRDTNATAIKAAFAREFDKPNLRTIEIWHSDIGSITADLFADKTTDYLYLGNNQITSIDFDVFNNMKTEMKTLEIYGSPAISSFEFSQLEGFQMLNKLHLAFTSITEVTSLPLLPSLSDIYLGYNLINSIEPFAFEGATDLSSLHLNGNKLSALGDYWLSFTSNRSLIWVDLVNNEIESITNSTFTKIGTSYEINFARNKFTRIPEEVFRPILEQLGIFGYVDLYPGVSSTDVLSGNEIICDCNLAWLVRADNSIGNRLQRSYCAHNSFPISQMPVDFFDDVCPQS